jgi:ribonuclease Z
MSKALKRVFIGLGILLVLAMAGLGLVRNIGVQDALFQRAIGQLLSAQTDTFGGDKIDVVFCGTASPMGDSAAQQCIGVLVADQFFIVDSGARSTAVAMAAGLPVERLNGVLLTHFHSDHISSLGELHLASWARGRPSKLKVYGGAGVEQVVDGFNMAYGLDYGYRTGHHGETVMPSKNAGFVAQSFKIPARGTKVIYQNGELTISAFTVSHPPIEPAYGYRFDYRGRSVVISGDTVKDGNLIDAAAQTDVLIHEVLQPHLVRMLANGLAQQGRTSLGQLLTDTLDYHTSPVQAAEAANEAAAKLLVFTHLAPSPNNPLIERMFMRGVDNIRQDGVVIAKDGMHISLPAPSGRKNHEIIVNQP